MARQSRDRGWRVEWRWMALMLASLGVAACGGGGGGGGSSGGGGGGGGGGGVVNGGMTLALFAGNTSGPGMADGTAGAAQFNTPNGVAVDSAGNLYVADTGNGIIRKVTAAGVVSTLAGAPGMSGSADGTGSAASFNHPGALAVDGSGNVFVADTLNSTLRKVSPAGVVTTLAGSAGSVGSLDGNGSSARFNRPGGIAIDASGTLYVADTYNSTVRKVTSAGVVTTLAGAAGSPGSADGSGAAAQFDYPGGVTVDGAGNVYVADTQNETIRKITAAGAVSTLAGSAGNFGTSDGTGAAAQFRLPNAVTVDGSGNVYVADSVNNTLRKVTAGGVVTTLAGNSNMAGSTDGTGGVALFNSPDGVAVDGSGNLYVADAGNSTLRKCTSAGVVTTLAGSAGMGGSSDGSGAAAGFSQPAGLAVDAAGNVYVADYFNNTIRKITAAGVVSTLAGSAGMGGSADGSGALAQFNTPAGVAVDGSGNAYVTDNGNNTIRVITPAGAVTTLAGTPGASGSNDGSGASAQFNAPTGIALDAAGNLYVADTGNSTIRKITPAGVVSTLAGTAGLFGSLDGAATTATFNGPTGLVVDAMGNVTVADAGNNTLRVISPAGTVTTLAGLAGATGTADGSGAAARFNAPKDVKLDSAGKLYVADSGNATIRVVTAAGAVTTLAGKSLATVGTLAAPLRGYPANLAVSGKLLYFSANNGIDVISGLP